jgi:hypothetical protein
MLNFPSFFDQGVQSTLRLKPGVNWSHKGQWVQIFNDTEIDRWYVGDFSSASYQITVEYNSNKKEILNALVVARPDEASVVIYGRVSIDDELITLTATVNDSYLSLKASPTISTFDGAKLIFLATYAQTINDLTVPEPLSYDAPQEETPGSGIIGGGSSGGGGGSAAAYIDDLLDVTILSPVQNQYLKFDGTNWVNSSLLLENYALINNPAFTGTVTGITAAMVGLGDVTNESKTTMFFSPAFTGTVTGITAAMVGLGNVTNQSKTTMFTSPTFTGTVNGITAAMVGLGNVTNESKSTMFTSPTFTGTVSGITATMIGLGNVTNESKATMFSSPTFTGTVSGITAAMVGLGNVTNESKTTMFSSPTINTPTITGYTESAPASVTVGTGTTAITDIIINSGTVLRYTLTAGQATTFTMPTATAGKSFMIFLKQPASGSAGSATFTSVVWGSLGAPTITATVGKLDIVTFIADGSKWYGSANQGYTY